MRIGAVVWNMFIVICLFVLATAGIYVYENGVHRPVPREIISETVEAPRDDTIKASTDYSAHTDPVIDSNGKLNIPDNTTISDIKSSVIKTDFCEFRIPDSWRDNVVIRVLKMDQTSDAELYEEPVVNTEVVQFFEANTFHKYQTQEYIYTEGASRRGKITELYVTDASHNKTKSLKKDPQRTYIANIYSDSAKYEVYLYQFRDGDGIMDEEFAKEYTALSSVDYTGCIISSFKSALGQVSPANSYIKTRYIDNFDVEGFGIRKKIDMSAYELRERNWQEDAVHEDEVPLMVKNAPEVFVYDWQPFSAPFGYADRGSSYAYSPMESGGAAVDISPISNPQDDSIIIGETYTAPDIATDPQQGGFIVENAEEVPQAQNVIEYTEQVPSGEDYGDVIVIGG